MSDLYDVIVIGAGPGGMTAAIYAKRAELKVLLIERNYMGGGQIMNTYEIDNYPGLPGLSGMELATKFSEHVDKLKVERVNTEVLSVKLDGAVKTVRTEDGDYEARTVILATGNSASKLNVPGEDELTGMGVSYCATCDGAFFKNRTVAVVGGGDVAVEDAIFLARGCAKVYVVHRRDELRATKSLQSALFACDNVEFIWASVIEEIAGEDMVEKVIVKNVKTGDASELSVNGVFIAVGNVPNSTYITGTTDADEAGETVLLLDNKGYIVAGEDCATNIPGVFAVGDVRTKLLRQVSTAVADGANAVYSVERYLVSHM